MGDGNNEGLNIEWRGVHAKNYNVNVGRQENRTGLNEPFPRREESKVAVIANIEAISLRSSSGDGNSSTKKVVIED
jgi:hypothetical protein